MNNDDQGSESLRQFLGTLTAGNSALSLRARKSAALTDYTPLAERVKAGDATAVDLFVKAAKVLLNIEREISGSQSGYFDLLDEVTSITRSAMELLSTAQSRTGEPGRPGKGFQLYEAEHRRRRESGEASSSVKAEAIQLREWFIQSNPALVPPTAKTIENRIRATHRCPENIVSGQFQG